MSSAIRCIALEMILLGTSPTPIGRTPGCLLNGIRRLAISGLKLLGSTSDVEIRLATAASEVHRFVEADLNEVHILFQIEASRPEGPADPFVRRALSLIRS
jgi:hypothetical protein